jgi:polyhydroxyalkanoate synthesis regulator phasin
MYTIKRYANGRFYDTVAKNYITRSQITKLLDAKKKISIVNTKDGKDVTAQIVSQLKAKQQKQAGKQKAKAKKGKGGKDEGGMVAKLIRKGGDTLSDYGKKYASMWDKLLTMSKDEIDRLVKLLVKDNKISATEAKRLNRELQGYRNKLQKWFSKNVDKRINDILNRMNLVNRQQVVKLTAKIDALNKKINQLEGRSPAKAKRAKKKTAKKPAAAKKAAVAKKPAAAKSK